MPAHIALLRAVNVGGRTMKMADLVAMARAAGLDEPRTLLQSGNLVFEANGADAALAAKLEAAAEARFGYATDFILRSAAEWQALIAANPFLDAAENDRARLHAVPLKAPPEAGALERLRAAIKGPESAALVGRDLYVVYPNGAGTSKLTISVIERVVGARGTARNWNTVLKLAAMAGA